MDAGKAVETETESLRRDAENRVCLSWPEVRQDSKRCCDSAFIFMFWREEASLRQRCLCVSSADPSNGSAGSVSHHMNNQSQQIRL